MTAVRCVVAQVAALVLAALPCSVPQPLAAQVLPTYPAASAKGPDERDRATREAREHFQRGTEYYAEGDHRAALVEFERAYELRPTYRLLYNLGQVAYELRDYAAAERHFRAYLVEGEGQITPERHAEVTVELARLRERVASVTIRTEPEGADIHIDERAVGRTPFDGPLRISAGRRRIVAELAGHAPVMRAVDVVGGENLDVAIELGPPLTAADRGADAPAADENWAPWVSGIATGVLAIGAAGFGYSAFRDDREYHDQLQGYTSRGQLEVLSANAQDKALVADILLGATLVGAAVTVVLILTGGEDEEEPTTDVARRGPAAF